MECVAWSDVIATLIEWRVYGQDRSLECCFSNMVVIMSDIVFHISFQTSNQPSFLINYNLFICYIVQVCGALECFLWSDGNATMMRWRVTCKILWWRLACTECIWMSNFLIMPVILHMTWLLFLNCDWRTRWSEVFIIVQVYFFICHQKQWGLPFCCTTLSATRAQRLQTVVTTGVCHPRSG